MSRLFAALLAVSFAGTAAASPPTTRETANDVHAAAHSLPMDAKWKLSEEGIWHVSIGQGRPILFIHGWTMDHRDEAYEYEPIFRQHVGWRRVYVDLPGMGRSARTPVSDQDEMLQRLLAFADREFAGTPYAIAGTSLGAYLADALATRRRDRIVGVLLRMPLVVADDAAHDLDQVRQLVEADDTAWPNDLHEARNEAVVKTRAYVEALAEKNAQRVAPAQVLANRSVLDPIRADSTRYSLSVPAPLANPVSTPALILTGRQDASVGYRDAWGMLDRYPRATYAALDRAQHGFPIDQVNRVLFTALVKEWLARVEEAIAKKAQQ